MLARLPQLLLQHEAIPYQKPDYQPSQQPHDQHMSALCWIEVSSSIFLAVAVAPKGPRPIFWVVVAALVSLPSEHFRRHTVHLTKGFDDHRTWQHDYLALGVPSEPRIETNFAMWVRSDYCRAGLLIPVGIGSGQLDLVGVGDVAGSCCCDGPGIWGCPIAG